MSDKSLRNKVIRLAHQKPELRKHLLPLVTKTAMYDKREVGEAIEDTIKYGQPHWNIDGVHSVRWTKGGCIIKSHIEFVIAGEVSGIYDEYDFNDAERYLVVSEHKAKAERECIEFAKSTLEKAFEDEDIAVQVGKIRSRIDFVADLGNGACSLAIEIETM